MKADLLEAAKRLSNALRGHDYLTNGEMAALEFAQAAIARAEGKA